MDLKKSGKNVCMYCTENRDPSYKNYEELKQFLSERGKIKSRRQTNLCAKHQRKLSVHIKRARQLALLPYVVI